MKHPRKKKHVGARKARKKLHRTQKAIVRQMYRETKGDPEWMRKFWEEPE